MAQARTLDESELAQVLAHIEHGRHAHRNRAMLLLTHWASLRVGEVAVLRWSDVINSDGAIKDEIRLLPDMTKGATRSHRVHQRKTKSCTSSLR